MNHRSEIAAIAPALLLGVAVLTGCNKKEDEYPPEPAESGPAVSAPAPRFAAAPSAPATSFVAAAWTTGPGTPAVTDAPGACITYVTRVSACLDKVDANSPGAVSFRRQLRASRVQWAQGQDKVALAAACTRSTELYSRSASQMGCQ